MSSFAADPGGNVGFNHAFWVSSINQMVVIFGGGPLSGSNSVRAFDPVTNTWTDLYTTDVPVGSPGHLGVPARDNHASFYVPQRDEIWVWGGSYINTMPDPAQRFYSGRFSLAGCHPAVFTNCGHWVYRSLSYADMGPGIVKNNVVGYGADPGCAWSESANRGMCGWGFNGDNAQIPFVVEPNDSKSVCPGAGTGSEPYIACYVQTGTLPEARVQCMNCLVAVGDDFYLYGGDFNGPRVDLWKFSGATHTWTRLPDSPPRNFATPVLTYDSDLNSLVVWAGDKIYGFDLASQQWSDRTPANLPCINNHVGTYSTIAKLHVYEGGTFCTGPQTDYNTFLTVGISLSGTGNPIFPPSPSLTSSTSSGLSNTGSPISPPSPVPTPSTSSGRTPVGYLDGIDANGIASGWTYDPDASSQNNTVQIYADGPAGSGTLIGALTATAPRPDVNSALGISGDHGFTFSIPANLKDGKQHQLYAYGIDLTGDANFLLNGSPKSFIFGSISSTPAPTPAPTLTSAPTPTSTVNATTGDATCYGGLCLPLRTWVAKPLPPQNSPCSAGAGCKQYSADLDTANGRIYFFGGDTNEGGQGGWGATYSLGIVNGDWIVEYPACGPQNQVQPSYPTEGAFSYDSVRNKLYWPGGNFFFGQNISSGRCVPDDNHQLPPMTFDPITKLWSTSAFPSALQAGIVSSNPQVSVYDPVTDALYSTSECSSGLCMSILNLSTNTWSSVHMPCADNNIGGLQGACGAGQTYVNAGFNKINNLYQGIDITGRAIYFIKQGDHSPTNPPRLLRYNIDLQTVSVMAELPIPDFPGDGVATNIAFDSVNRVVYWWTHWENPDSVLYIYHPAQDGSGNGTWELDAMFQPEGVRPRGFTTVYDSQHNVFVIMGGVNWDKAIDPNPSFLSYYFLYRYGNGDGQPYVPPTPVVTPPAAPTPIASPPAQTPAGGPAGYTFCATENQTCSFSGQKSVAYGANNNFTFLNITGGTACTNLVFGDPVFGTVKACYIRDILTQAPVPSQAPFVSLLPANLTFPSQVIGSPPASQQVSLSNAGNAPLTINGISVTGDFSQLSTCSSPQAPGATCMITVSFQPLMPGTRTGILSIVDNAAGSPHIISLTGSAAVPLTTDTTPPSVSILSPAGGTVSKTVRGKIKAADNVAISKIELYKDGALVGTAASDSYSFHWDTTNDRNGTHTLIAMAYDTSNNRSSAVVSVDVQNVASAPPIIAPSIVIQSPVSGTIINTESVTLSAEVSSPTSIRNVQFKLDGVNLGPKIKSAPYILAWDTTNVSNGTHVITATVHDVAGNTGTSSGTTVQLNRPAVKRPALGRRF